MRHLRVAVVLTAVASLAAVGLAGRAALAADAKLEVTVKPVKAEVEVGDDIELEVAVKNIGKETADLNELAFDRQSVSFDVSLKVADKSFVDAQIHPNPYELKRPETKPLKAGETWKRTLTIPAVIASDLEVTALYAGHLEKWEEGKEIASEPAKVKVKPKNGANEVVARMKTNAGELTLRFFAKDALRTVHNFVRLAKARFYDGKIFHRIVASEHMGVIQGGCPQGTGRGGPGWTIAAEINPNKHTKGAISMARSQHMDSAGSQFFLCTKPVAHLDGGYTVFGEVTKGLDVLEKLGSVPIEGGAQDGKPSREIKMESVKIEAAKE